MAWLLLCIVLLLIRYQFVGLFRAPLPILIALFKHIMILSQSYHTYIFSPPQLPESYCGRNTDKYLSKTVVGFKIYFQKYLHLFLPHPPRLVFKTLFSSENFVGYKMYKLKKALIVPE